jgi:hypothetical protein
MYFLSLLISDAEAAYRNGEGAVWAGRGRKFCSMR